MVTRVGERSFLFQLRDGVLVGEGEASPLPGYSLETVEECAAALAGGATTPAADFARFAAKLDLDGKRQGRPAHALLGATRTRLPLSSLVASVAEAENAWARGVRVLKVKDPALLAPLRARFADAELRLDMNGRAADPSVLASRPLYIEEGGLAPRALDESLQRRSDEEVARMLARREIAALVLKPMTLGPGRCLALAALAAANDVPVTITHCMDGPIALAAAAALALALPGRVLAVGLDRHRGLDAWPPASIAALGDAEIRATDAPGLGVTWT